MGIKKILHVSHSLDTGGGPLYVEKIIRDLPGYEHFVVGNSGHFADLFSRLIPGRIFILKGKNVLANVIIL